jgi:hypothetical protein
LPGKILRIVRKIRAAIDRFSGAAGPDNVLFVGDITGAAVRAFALRETDLTPQKDVDLRNFHNFEGRDLIQGLDQKLAALFGTTYDKIVVNDLVVHQSSEQIFVSVERGCGTDAVPAIVVTIDVRSAPRIGILDLQSAQPQPTGGPILRRSQPSPR